MFKSDEETINLLNNFIRTLEEYELTNIIKNCEETNGCEFPSDFNQYVITQFTLNLNNIKEIIQQVQINNNFNRR